MNKKISIVIVNYRTTDLLLRCLESLSNVLVESINNVVIVDNLSNDGSLEKLKRYISGQALTNKIELIEADRNGGFSFGNNIGTKYCFDKYPEVEYIWYLNPDAFIRDFSLDHIIELYSQAGNVGVVGTGQRSSSSGLARSSSFNFPRPFTEFLLSARVGPLFRLFKNFVVSRPPSEEIEECDWVSGASFFAPKALFQKIGYWDEQYFLYFEEVDFCKRSKASGFSVFSDQNNCVYHEDESTTGVGRQPGRRPGFWFHSRWYFYHKHYGLLGAICADLSWLLGRPIFWIGAVILGKPIRKADPKSFTWDMLRNDIRLLFKSFRRDD